VQRFYDQVEGTIEFGTLDSRKIPVEVLQSHLAIVSQSSVLFEGDIRFNLCVSGHELRSCEL
jgi:ABC-type bacteriocin/lantibiotic exporter with double-glycine peptidase domain